MHYRPNLNTGTPRVVNQTEYDQSALKRDIDELRAQLFDAEATIAALRTTIDALRQQLREELTR